jgi:hypothetical protein
MKKSRLVPLMTVKHKIKKMESKEKHDENSSSENIGNELISNHIGFLNFDRVCFNRSNSIINRFSRYAE